jgi:hypothetical protein
MSTLLLLTLLLENNWTATFFSGEAIVGDPRDRGEADLTSSFLVFRLRLAFTSTMSIILGVPLPLSNTETLLSFVDSETVSFVTISIAEQGAEATGAQLLFFGGGGNTSNRNISSDTMTNVFLLNVDKSNGGVTAAVLVVEAPRAIATFHRLGHASLAFNIVPGFSRHPVNFTLTSTDIMIGDTLVDLAPVPAPRHRPPTPRPSSSSCC